jgi:hypothetical protein
MRQSVPVKRCRALKRDGKICNHAASLLIDGVPFCGLHDPEKMKERNTRRKAERIAWGDYELKRRDQLKGILRVARELLETVIKNNDSRYQEFIDRHQKIADEERRSNEERYATIDRLINEANK